MKLSAIQSAISKTLGIATLNAMQTAVAASDAERLLLLSPTGSGKTLAFTIAILRHYDKQREAGTVHAVVIAPSRELVRQIFEVVRPTAAIFGIKALALYGGQSFAIEESSLRGDMPGIIVATPGRLLDHLDRGSLSLDKIGLLVLDEYDKILELGFYDEMRSILRTIPGISNNRRASTRLIVTSATKLTEIPDFLNLDHTETIDFTTDNNGVRSRLRIVNVPSQERDKLATLGALIRNVARNGRCIVFVNHRESAERIGDYLSRQKISNAVYHGGLEQQQREMALARFDSNGAKVLVTTDLAGRGIDIEGVESVIHYHMPINAEVWTHRNGRTARVDRTGEIYLITGPEENMPEFVEYDNDFYPDMTDDSPVKSDKTVIYFDRGKRDKISRGDVAGFVMKQCGVPSEDVGKITIGNNYALVAVSPSYASAIMDTARTNKLKNQRVRASILK